MLTAIIAIVVAVVWLIAVLIVFALWCRGGRGGNGITPAPKPQRDDRPRMLNPRPSLESIEQEMERNNAIDQRNRKRKGIK